MEANAKCTVRVAVVQAGSVAFNVDASLKKLEKLCTQASENGAQLVLFPEAFLPCYPRGYTFDSASITSCLYKEGRDSFQMYWDSAIQVPGPIIDKLSLIAKENKIYLNVGVIERDGNSLYCTMVFFANDGKYLGKHRKLVPTALERVLWAYGDGSTLPVFDLPIGKIGTVICWENYMPLLRMAMYSKGIQIYCAPNADDSEGWLCTVRHIALEGRCFVLNCNQFVQRSDFPPTFIDPLHDKDLRMTAADENYVMCRGGSAIIGPNGEILAGPHYEGEITLYANLDLNQVVKGKFELDVVGHYARPDVFTLHVNERANRNVVFRQYHQKEKSECQPERLENPDAKEIMKH